MRVWGQGLRVPGVSEGLRVKDRKLLIVAGGTLYPKPEALADTWVGPSSSRIGFWA